MLTNDSLSCILSLQQVNLSHNQLTSLPSGLLHLTLVQRVFAAKNQLTSLFDIPQGVFPLSPPTATQFTTEKQTMTSDRLKEAKCVGFILGSS